MVSLNPDSETKQDLDDSGYVQDDTATKQAAEESKGPHLLDLSDDVLLYILQYCSPQDLKALGYTCPRLGALVLDRTLWMDVDVGDTRYGRRRVRWLLTQALGPHTRRLRLAGYAREAEGCLGFVNRYDLSESNNAGAPGQPPPEEERYLCGGPRVYRLTQTLPRYGGGFPYWPHAGAGPAMPPQPSPAKCPNAPPAADGCPGPQLTLTHTGLRELTALCTSLRTLELEDCIIDCHTINIGMFPKTLTKLSLKGTKCFNLESKSFLFKIQDHLTELEELDVSYCSWIEPACMLPLSKLSCLRKLMMRECTKLSEFVAYASLATRYGFKQLKFLDLRGSPVGDSEVSALGWLPLLEELYLSPSPDHPRVKEHAHYSQDLLPAHTELEVWEETEPDYFRTPQVSDEQWDRDEENVNENRSHYYNTTSDDPSACILLERMIAEPVAPEEYSQVYHQFLAGHQNNMPLANPEEYREAYRHYMERPNIAHPPAGYSLFIRKQDDARKQQRAEPTPAKRRKHDHAEPDTSKEAEAIPSTSGEPGPSKSCTSREADCKPSTSSDEPGPSTSFDARASITITRATRKRDSDDSSSDDDSPPSKRACALPAAAEPTPAAAEPAPGGKAKKDSRGANKSSKKAKEAANKKKKDEKRKLPRRVFEITINELNTLELLVPPDMPNNAADDYADYVNNEGANATNGADNANKAVDNANNGAENANNAVDNANNGADNANNGADNVNNAVDNSNNGADNVNNAVDNACNVADNANNVTDNANNRADNANNVTGNANNAVDNANNGANDDKKEGKDTKEAKIVDNNNANNGADIANNGNNNNNNRTDSGNNGAIDNKIGNNNVNNGADNDNKEGNVTNEVKKINNEPNDVNKGASNANNGSNDDNNVNNNANNAANNVNNGVNNANNEADNANNEANNANNEANNANVGINPIGQAILDAVHNIFNNEAVANAINIADNAAQAAARSQRIFQFRQYRRPIVIEEFVNACDEPVGARRLPHGVLFSGGNIAGGPVRLDHSALVSDSSIRRFGRAIGENINYIHIGGVGVDTNARPDRSNLRVLSVTGYRRITDASLTHLATAAPYLRELDVSRTAVSAAALASFRAMRPDVRVLGEQEPKPKSPAPQAD